MQKQNTPRRGARESRTRPRPATILQFTGQPRGVAQFKRTHKAEVINLDEYRYKRDYCSSVPPKEWHTLPFGVLKIDYRGYVVSYVRADYSLAKAKDVVGELFWGFTPCEEVRNVDLEALRSNAKEFKTTYKSAGVTVHMTGCMDVVMVIMTATGRRSASL
jgi:hypothetical protein